MSGNISGISGKIPLFNLDLPNIYLILNLILKIGNYLKSIVLHAIIPETIIE